MVRMTNAQKQGIEQRCLMVLVRTLPEPLGPHRPYRRPRLSHSLVLLSRILPPLQREDTKFSESRDRVDSIPGPCWSLALPA